MQKAIIDGFMNNKESKITESGRFVPRKEGTIYAYFVSGVYSESRDKNNHQVWLEVVTDTKEYETLLECTIRLDVSEIQALIIDMQKALDTIEYLQEH